MSKIQEDSFWFVDEGVPEDEQKMQALCRDCAEEKKCGWFWQGSTTGYGDYDLKCSVCEHVIHQRKEEYAE